MATLTLRNRTSATPTRRPAESLDILMRRHQDAVKRFLTRMVHDEFAAEDLCQETFLKIHRHRDRFDTACKFEHWLYAIARNAALDYLRARKRDRAVFVDEVEQAFVNDPLDTISDGEETTVLRDAMNSLTEEEREALVSKEANDETFREIGERLDCTISHVRTLITHAKTALRDRMLEFEAPRRRVA